MIRRGYALAAAFLLVASLAVAAIATDRSPVAPPVKQHSGPPIIEYYGDSTVWGYASGRDGARVADPAPAVFAMALPARLQYSVKNEGVSGSTACSLLAGTDGVHQPWRIQMAQSKATYVILNHAINDQWKYSVEEYRNCLWSLARIARQSGKHVIFETPNPTRDSGSGGLDTYVGTMRAVALLEQVPVIDQYRYLTDYLQGRKLEELCPDGLHPSDAVYRMKGEYAARTFADIVVGK
jgi:lysophospholipase L1-like esterase